VDIHPLDSHYPQDFYADWFFLRANIFVARLR
jgi:hypothetical protein